jgi:hypothetical protein
MYRPTFQARYTAFYDALQRDPQRPVLDQDTLKWLPLLFIVVSLPSDLRSADTLARNRYALSLARTRRPTGAASRLVPALLRLGALIARVRQSAAERQPRRPVCRFAGCAVYVSDRTVQESADHPRLLTRRPAEGSTPLTTAFQLGLYRDGTVINLADKREIEIRRRAWAMLYHLDR